MNINDKLNKRWIFAAIFLVVTVQLFLRAFNDLTNKDIFEQSVYEMVYRHSMYNLSPVISYISGDWKKRTLVEEVWNLFYDDMPLEACALRAAGDNTLVLEYMQNNTETIQEGLIGTEQMEDTALETTPQNVVEPVGTTEDNHAVTETDLGITLEEAVLAENTAATGFVPVQSPVAIYAREQLRDPGFVKSTFYAEDATTYIREDQLNYDVLTGFDATIKQDNSNVQILVYHTHSQETYADSTPGDPASSIVGVGEHLCDILRTQYGFNVLHHTGEYDVKTRDDAYANAAEGLEKVLAENPSIEVMIDLHRDETGPNTKLVTTIQDKPMAKLMFFNGLCYTRALGTLSNLPNPYVQDNISFAFQLQLAAEEYYPGLTRRIYLKGYRYNLHYRPKSLLIELGAQTNTVEEAMNSCEPLAHIIAMILNGENKVY